jgi:hypothetical protein
MLVDRVLEPSPRPAEPEAKYPIGRWNGAAAPSVNATP